MAQTITVSGRVTDKEGAPMAGVNIVVKGTTNGTNTDVDGKYSISTPANAILQFSFIGMKSVEEAVGGRSIIDVVLESESMDISEVVVIGYGTSRKKDITTAVSVVSTEDFDKRPVTNVAQAIQGKAAGVQVVLPSGKPGGDAFIRVRGATSVLAGNDPLFVIDGVPTTSMQALNPQDIETVQVLKDASSAAIYGARAANGVVIITTKHAKAGVASVSVNSYMGFSNLANSLDVLNTEQYRELMDEVKGPGTVPTSQTNYTNWIDETFSTGQIQNYQVSVSNGTEKMKYYFSAGFSDEKGIVKPAENKKYTIRTNINSDLFKWLKFGTNISFIHNWYNDVSDNANSGRAGTILSAINTPPFLHIWDPNNPEQYEVNPFQNSWENPLAYASRINQSKTERVLANANTEITFLKDFKLKSNFGIDGYIYQRDLYIDPVKTVYGRTENGIGEADKSNSLVWLIENVLSYEKTFGNHNLSVQAGQSAQSSRWDQSYISAKDFPKNSAVTTINAANQITYAASSASEWAIASFFGRVSYNYMSKYLFTANFRYDGSSKLSSDNRWDFFPSFSAAWRLSSEPFLKNVVFINDLKIRGGWGRNGNQEGIGDYAWQALYGFSRQSPTSPLSGPGIYQMNLENPSLKWEVTYQSNVGLDLTVLDSHLSFTGDVYWKNTDGLLVNVPLPSGSAAVDYITRNDGKMKNWGVELSLDAKDFRHELKWSTNLFWSMNRNEITELQLSQIYNFAQLESNNEYVIRMSPGYSLGTFYGYVAKGVDPETGDMIYEDRNNNGVIDPDDRTVIGSAEPDFIYGLNQTLTYKGIGLTLFFQGSQGNDIFNASRIDTEGMFDVKNQTTEVLRRWKRPGQITDIPRAVSNGSTFNVHNSTRFVEDGSYFRLKALTLSYSLPSKWLSRVSIKNFTLYATATNLFTITGYNGFDPEVNYGGNNSVIQGVDYGTYPQSRSYIFGLSFDF
ncbi:MAG: TonB-dependent receptor [Bacteroidales bacterium]|jgi:TonB-linked SusC/RagA family outer membrane protein|nr:TonB-dependent receptor [Bacteroidales bacterium]MBP8643891.1 TonB-dependent receptor [Bacteroidales bacterium]NLI87608.1 TonB-dependent receptor [Bacteroidales bacterium]